MNFKTEEKRIDKLIQDGLVRLELGQVAEALLEFESALFFDSENLAANCLAATCLSRLERPAEAEALIQKAIALAPGLALPHLVAAEVMEATGRQDQAEFHLMEGVSKEPHNAGLRVELGRFLIQSSRPKEACVHLRRALEISPKQADARAARRTSTLRSISPPS
jgi:Tfp pilus assembly protein PilF